MHTLDPDAKGAAAAPVGILKRSHHRTRRKRSEHKIRKPGSVTRSIHRPTTWLVCFCLTAAIFIWTASSMQNVGALQCYTDLEYRRITTCKEDERYRTCFTRFDQYGNVTGRGCSTKDKVFDERCEVHAYGNDMERMCFCSYFLCNRARPSGEPLSVWPHQIAVLVTLTTAFVGFLMQEW